MKNFEVRSLVAAFCFLLGSSLPGLAAEMPKPPLAGGNVIKYSPSLTTASLAGRPDTDLVELSDGSRLKVGSIRRLQAAQQKMRAAVPGSRLPAALKAKPAAAGFKVNNAADLSEALKRPDGDTVELKSGKRITVGQLKFLRPHMEKRLGRNLAALPTQPLPQDPVVTVNPAATKSTWESILKQPGNTVLVSPKGKRITVDQLKQFLLGSQSSTPMKTAPSAPQKAK